MNRSIALLLPLAACAPAPPMPAPGPSAAAYRALGTEPFWSVTLANGRMVYEGASGPAIDVAAPPARSIAGGRRHASDRLMLDIVARPCSDGMSDRRYPDTVRVAVDGRELKGCGMPVEADVIEGREWRVGAIGGQPPAGPNPATLRFADGRVSGTTGCNRLMGSYTLAGDRLAPDGIATTRIACPGAAMEQEAAIVAALRGPLTIVQGKDGVTLTGAGGTLLTLVPIRP